MNHENFNPPTPCGVGRDENDCCTNCGKISIHPLRAEWDGFALKCCTYFDTFQSTHSVRSGTLHALRIRQGSVISIHPLRAEWDSAHHVIHAGDSLISIHPLRAEWDDLCPYDYTTNQYFNPPTPCGVGRALPQMSQQKTSDFNPPTPCGVGHGKTRKDGGQERISIHPLRAEWDKILRAVHLQLNHFNPPTPCGVGRRQPRAPSVDHGISIHPLRAEWDAHGARPRTPCEDFNPPTPCGVGLDLKE